VKITRYYGGAGAGVPGHPVFVKGRGWSYRHGNSYVGSFVRQTTSDPFARSPQSQNQVKAGTNAYELSRIDRKNLLDIEGRIDDIVGEIEKLTEQIEEVGGRN
jgi:hypothetical protein